MSTTFATCSHLKYVYDSLRWWTNVFRSIPQPLQHVHDKLTIDAQQKYYSAILTTRQRLLQQPHNNMTKSPQNSRPVYNKRTTDSKQDDLYGNQALQCLRKLARTFEK